MYITCHYENYEKLDESLRQTFIIEFSCQIPVSFELKKKERKKGVRAIRRIAGSKSLFNVTSIVEKILGTIT